MEESSDLTKLEQKREQFRAKTFRMMLQIALVFGLPAAIAVMAGTKLDTAQASGRSWTLGLLAVAFVLSWALVIRIYKKLSQEAREVDTALRKLKTKKDKSEI